jgi:hypothetical protein
MQNSKCLIYCLTQLDRSDTVCDGRRDHKRRTGLRLWEEVSHRAVYLRRGETAAISILRNGNRGWLAATRVVAIE